MMDQTDLLKDNELLLEKSSFRFLRAAAMWAKFLSILGYFYSLAFAGAGIAIGVSSSKIFSRVGKIKTARLIEGGIYTMLYMAGAIIIFLMSLYLFRFAKKVKAAINYNDSKALNVSLKNLNRFFLFAGLISLVTTLIMAYAIVGFMIESAYSR